jgi:hypothetical protein
MSQRGDSGIQARIANIASSGTAPSAQRPRQPADKGRQRGARRSIQDTGERDTAHHHSTGGTPNVTAIAATLADEGSGSSPLRSTGLRLIVVTSRLIPSVLGLLHYCEQSC